MKPKNLDDVELDVHLTEKIVAKEIISREEFESRLSCHKIHIPGNAEYPIHEHPSEHIILLLSGAGWMKLWKNNIQYSFDLRQGDVFFVPANVPHQVGAYTDGADMLAVSCDSLPLTNPERLRVVEK